MTVIIFALHVVSICNGHNRARQEAILVSVAGHGKSVVPSSEDIRNGDALSEIMTKGGRSMY